MDRRGSLRNRSPRNFGETPKHWGFVVRCKRRVQMPRAKRRCRHDLPRIGRAGQSNSITRRIYGGVSNRGIICSVDSRVQSLNLVSEAGLYYLIREILQLGRARYPNFKWGYQMFSGFESSIPLNPRNRETRVLPWFPNQVFIASSPNAICRNANRGSWRKTCASA